MAIADMNDAGREVPAGVMSSARRERGLHPEGLGASLGVGVSELLDGSLLFRSQPVHLRLGEGITDGRPVEVDVDAEGQGIKMI